MSLLKIFIFREVMTSSTAQCNGSQCFFKLNLKNPVTPVLGPRLTLNPLVNKTLWTRSVSWKTARGLSDCLTQASSSQSRTGPKEVGLIWHKTGGSYYSRCREGSRKPVRSGETRMVGDISRLVVVVVIVVAMVVTVVTVVGIVIVVWVGGRD